MSRWGWAGLAALVLLAWLASLEEPDDGERSRTEPNGAASSRYQEGDCGLFVELVPAAEIARQLGRSEASVLSSYRINIWSERSEHGKGRAVGELIPGSRAQILDQGPSDYLIRSPLDGSVGWISRIQVEGTRWQDVRTNEACNAARDKSNVIRCPDGTLYVGNNPDQACR